MRQSTLSTIAMACLAFTQTSAQVTKLLVDHVSAPDACNSLRTAKAGDLLKVMYRASIDEESRHGVRNQEYDSTYTDTHEPAPIVLGAKQVIKGLEIALLGSCKGAKLIARIPPHLGYGPHGTPDVPANSTIRFELEVVDVSDAKQPNMFGKIDKDHDKRLSQLEVKTFAEEVAKGYLNWTQVFDKDDHDADGFVTFDEFSGPKGQPFPFEEIDPAEGDVEVEYGEELGMHDDDAVEDDEESTGGKDEL